MARLQLRLASELWIMADESETELEQLANTRISDVHLVNLAGQDQSDSSGSEDYETDESYKPLLSYGGKPKHVPREREPPSLCRRLAAVKWGNVLAVAVAVFDYFLVYSAISLIGTFFPTQVRLPDSLAQCVILDSDLTKIASGTVMGSNQVQFHATILP